MLLIVLAESDDQGDLVRSETITEETANSILMDAGQVWVQVSRGVVCANWTPEELDGRPNTKGHSLSVAIGDPRE